MPRSEKKSKILLVVSSILWLQFFLLEMPSHATHEEPQLTALSGQPKEEREAPDHQKSDPDELMTEVDLMEGSGHQSSLSPPQISVEDFMADILATGTPYQDWEVLFAKGGPQLFIRNVESTPVEVRLLNEHPMPIIPETLWFFDQLPEESLNRLTSQAVSYRYQVIMRNQFAFSFYLVRRLRASDLGANWISISEAQQLKNQLKPQMRRPCQVSRERIESCMHSVRCLSHTTAVSLEFSAICTLPFCCNLYLPLCCSGVGLQCCTQMIWTSLLDSEQPRHQYQLQPQVISAVQGCVQGMADAGAGVCRCGSETTILAELPHSCWEYPYAPLRFHSPSVLMI